VTDVELRAELAKVQIDAAAARANAEHWERCAKHWQRIATELRGALAGKMTTPPVRRPSTRGQPPRPKAQASPSPGLEAFK
jgi:uncharacterized membrane protein YccC